MSSTLSNWLHGNAARAASFLLIGAMLVPSLIASGAETDEKKNTSDMMRMLLSGPTVGSVIQPFFVRAVTGPHRNRSVCYVCRYGARPVVMVLIQRVDPELPRLLRAIDESVDAARVDGLRSFGVLITDESATAVPILQTMAFDEHIQMPLTAATSAVSGPGAAALHPQAATTIVLYRDQKAVLSRGYELRQIDAAAVEKLRGDIKRVLLDAE